jgi:hypothetical protein
VFSVHSSVPRASRPNRIYHEDFEYGASKDGVDGISFSANPTLNKKKKKTKKQQEIFTM